MTENPIEMSLVNNRKCVLKRNHVDNQLVDYKTVMEHVDKFADTYISQCNDSTYANENYRKCINILEAVKNINESKYNKLKNTFCNYVIPHITDLDDLQFRLEESGQLYDSNMISIVENYKVADRILKNYDKINNRFDIDHIFATNGVFESCYIVADKINSYDMSLNNKISIALETCMYGLYKKGAKYTRKEVLENVTEYFLSVNNTLSDLDMKKIQKSICNTKLVSSLDCSDLKFLSEDCNYYSLLMEKVSEEKIEKEVNDIIKQMMKAKSKKEAHTLINKVASIIIGSYIAIETISMVSLIALLDAVIVLAYLVGLAPAILLKSLIDKIDKLFIKEKNNANKEEQKELEERLNKVMKQIKYIDTNKIHEYTLYEDNYIIESEDFADSNDVKKALKAYKVDQCKDVSKLKRIITRFYAKTPEQVIDETPNLLAWIRMAFVFSTVQFSPIITIPLFLVDQFISIGLQRKEAERMVKIFTKERDKAERRSYSVENSEKIDKYIKCLDKCIYNLERYRDSQYSEKEIEKRDELEECTSILEYQVSLSDINSDLKNIRKSVKDIEKSISGNSNLYIKEDILNEFYNSSPIEFINENGFLEIPIAENKDYGVASVYADRLSSVNKDYTALVEYTDDAYEIHLVNKNHINLNESEQEKYDNCIPYDIRKQLNNITTIAGNIDYINSLNPMGINKEIKENFNALMECPELTCRYVRNSKNIVDLKEFYSLLEDYEKDHYNDFIKSTEINFAKKILSEELLELDPSSELLMEAQSILGIRNIINEGINTTNIKTACLNMKKKIVNLSAKEKQLSQNLDAQAEVFSRNVQKAMIANKRESIIKGSVIPSFSKIIKTSLVAGGAFLINPVVAVIGCMGALAVSKKLTRRERKAILDEIEVELKVVERQISKAESDGNMKEYRHYLTAQRKLEREKMRIIYSLGPDKQVPSTVLAHLDKDDD